MTELLWYSHGNHPESAEEAIDGNKTAQCQLHSTPIFDTKLPGGGFPRRTGAGPPTECSSESVVYPPKSVLQESGSTAQMVSDFSLTISGVMPRRDDLPRPSLHHINRVFKVVFLGNYIQAHVSCELLVLSCDLKLAWWCWSSGLCVNNVRLMLSCVGATRVVL